MAHNNRIVEYYDGLAKDYDCSRFGNSYGKYIDRQERQTLDLLNISPERTMDLPCGTGRLLNYADYGMDTSKNMLEIARQRWLDKHLTCGDARHIAYEDESFDTVITMHLLMHLDITTIREIMEDVHRILSPGGRWIVDIPSLKRRKLTNPKNMGWHGNTSMDIVGLENLMSGYFRVNSVYGIMLTPIHRLPNWLRKPLCPIDYKLAQCKGIKEYSSYLIYELWKL